MSKTALESGGLRTRSQLANEGNNIMNEQERIMQQQQQRIQELEEKLHNQGVNEAAIKQVNQPMRSHITPGELQREVIDLSLAERLLELKSKRKADLIKLKEIRYKDASKMENLNEWLFQVGKLEKQLITQDGPMVLAEFIDQFVSLSWDEGIQRWYESRVNKRKNELKPDFRNWQELKKEFTTFFLATGDEVTAVAQLKATKMKPNEEMVDYIQRCLEITSRISDKRKSSNEKAELVFEGVSTKKYQQTMINIVNEQEEYRQENDGEGYGLELMVQELQKHAVKEPSIILAKLETKLGNSDTSSTGSKNGSSNGSTKFRPKSTSSTRNSNTNSTTQLNAIEKMGDEEQIMTTKAELFELFKQLQANANQTTEQLNAMKKASTPTGSGEPDGVFRCFRCKKPGHMARECSLPDTRKCRNCGEVGRHGTKQCPLPPNQKEGTTTKND